MTIYKVTGYFEGVVYAQYKNGLLDHLLADIKGFDTPAPGVGDMFPMKEADLLACTEAFKAVAFVPKSVAEKVALFCLKYKEHKGQPYRAQKEEKANLKTVTVNEQLLNTYFTGVQYPLSQTKTMADYVRHYNTVRDLAANGKQVKSAFPAVYDKQYEQMISDDVSKLQRYWEHLRGLGWKKVEGVWKQEKV